MDRRAFLGLLAGAAIATQLPATVLESQGDLCIRYVRIWDPVQQCEIVRIDVASMDLHLPKVGQAYKIDNVSPEYLQQALDVLKRRTGIEDAAIRQLKKSCSSIQPNQIFGIHYREAA